MPYTIYADVNRKDTTLISTHVTLAGAGKAYQRVFLDERACRVLDDAGKDVTDEAVAANKGEA